MEEVPNYGLYWFAYVLLAGCFMALSFWHSRKLRYWLQIPLLAFIAAMAFTPATTMQGDSWWSPAAIVMIFEIDQNGVAGFWRAGLGIIMVWIVLTIGSFITRWLMRRKRPIDEPTEYSKNTTKQEPELGPPD